MNPHFLFNSLNSIAQLIQSTDPRKAEACVERLAEIFRYLLHRAEHDFVPLAEELEVAEAYLDIERARFGDALRVEERRSTRGPRDLLLPRLILQPLVENAVQARHLAARSAAARCRSTPRIDDGDLAPDGARHRRRHGPAARGRSSSAASACATCASACCASTAPSYAAAGRSAQPGAGTTVTPAHPGRRSGGAPDVLRTLVVDDEKLARDRLCGFLRGIDDVEIVGEATNGPEAVALIEERRPDLVFLDVQMPGMDGFEVLKAAHPPPARRLRHRLRRVRHPGLRGAGRRLPAQADLARTRSREAVRRVRERLTARAVADAELDAS